MNKDLITKAVELVTFLFAAFGQFLLKIAPPTESNTSFSIGVSSFILLGVLLLVASVTKKRQSKRMKHKWIIVSVFLLIMGAVAGYVYKTNMDKYTLIIPVENSDLKLIIGKEFTADARKYAEENPGSLKELVMSFGLENIDEIWTRESRRKTDLMLNINYTLFVLFICSAIFCIIEGLATNSKFRKQVS